MIDICKDSMKARGNVLGSMLSFVTLEKWKLWHTTTKPLKLTWSNFNSFDILDGDPKKLFEFLFSLVFNVLPTLYRSIMTQNI